MSKIEARVAQDGWMHLDTWYDYGNVLCLFEQLVEHKKFHITPKVRALCARPI